MRAKSVLLLVIALGCGVVASVAVSQAVLDQKNGEAVQKVPILVAAKEISAATKIPADSFRTEEWAIDRVPIGAIADAKMLENKFTKQRIYPGEAIIEAKLTLKGRDFTVPEGYRTFDIAVKDETGGGGYIGPGDHVDVYGYFEKGARIHAAKSVKVMENLEVVMIDGVAIVDPEATKQKKSSTIQLLVKDSQYIVLDTASNLGKLRLALRPPAKVVAGGDKTDDGEKFIAWLKESEAKPVEKIVTDAIVPPSSKPENPQKHEMVIVSPSKSTMYRWTEGQMLPQKVDLDQPQSETSTTDASPATPTNVPAYRTPTQAQSSNSATSPPGSRTAQTASPVSSENSLQPNLSWDPSSGNWQSGGFKATYPNTK